MAKTSLDLMHGTVAVLILKTLSWGPMHGYDISRTIRQRSDGALGLEDAALYQALHRLEQQGVDRGRVGRSRRTTAGPSSTGSPTRGGASSRRRSRPGSDYVEAVSKVLESRLEDNPHPGPAPLPVPLAHRRPGGGGRRRGAAVPSRHGRARSWSTRAGRPKPPASRRVRRFGDLEGTRKYCRALDASKEKQMKWMQALEAIGQDLRFAVRQLAKSPGFTLVAS